MSYGGKVGVGDCAGVALKTAVETFGGVISNCSAGKAPLQEHNEIMK